MINDNSKINLDNNTSDSNNSNSITLSNNVGNSTENNAATASKSDSKFIRRRQPAKRIANSQSKSKTNNHKLVQVFDVLKPAIETPLAIEDRPKSPKYTTPLRIEGQEYKVEDNEAEKGTEKEQEEPEDINDEDEDIIVPSKPKPTRLKSTDMISTSPVTSVQVASTINSQNEDKNEEIIIKSQYNLEEERNTTIAIVQDTDNTTEQAREPIENKTEEPVNQEIKSNITTQSPVIQRRNISSSKSSYNTRKRSRSPLKPSFRDKEIETIKTSDNDNIQQTTEVVKETQVQEVINNEIKVEPDVETTIATETEENIETEIDQEQEQEPDVEIEPEVNIETEVDNKTEIEPEVNIEQEIAIATGPEQEPEQETDIAIATEPEQETEVNIETETATETETETETEQETEVNTETELKQKETAIATEQEVNTDFATETEKDFVIESVDYPVKHIFKETVSQNKEELSDDSDSDTDSDLEENKSTGRISAVIKRRRSTKRDEDKKLEKIKKELEEIERNKQETQNKLNKDKKLIEETQKNIENAKKEAEKHKKQSLHAQQEMERARKQTEEANKKLLQLKEETQRIEREINSKANRLNDMTQQTYEFEKLKIKAKKEADEAKKEAEHINKKYSPVKIKEESNKLIISPRRHRKIQGSTDSSVNSVSSVSSSTVKSNSINKTSPSVRSVANRPSVAPSVVPSVSTSRSLSISTSPVKQVMEVVSQIIDENEANNEDILQEEESDNAIDQELNLDQDIEEQETEQDQGQDQGQDQEETANSTEQDQEQNQEQEDDYYDDNIDESEVESKQINNNKDLRQGSMFDITKLPSSIKNAKNGYVPVTYGGYSRMVPEYSKMSNELQIYYREMFRMKIYGYAKIFNNMPLINVDDASLEEVHVCVEVYERQARVNLRCNQYRIALVFFWYAIELACWWSNISRFDFAQTQMENCAEYEIILMELSERDIGSVSTIRKESLGWRLIKSSSMSILIFALIQILSKWLPKPMVEGALQTVVSYYTGAQTGVVNRMNVKDNIRGINTKSAREINRNNPNMPTSTSNLNPNSAMPRPGGGDVVTDNGNTVFNAVSNLGTLAGQYIGLTNKNNTNSRSNMYEMDNQNEEPIYGF